MSASASKDGAPLHFVRVEPLSYPTCARLVAYRGFSGDDDFAAQAIKDSQWDKGTTTTTTKAVLPPEPAYDPEDTNDEFCFQCGSGGDLLLCDKCDRCAPADRRARPACVARHLPPAPDSSAARAPVLQRSRSPPRFFFPASVSLLHTQLLPHVLPAGAA